MNLTEEHYKEIEYMAGLFFSVEDICINLELDIEDTEHFKLFVELNKTSGFVQAYKKGRLGAEVELRQTIKQAALNGSNPAQMSMIDYFNDSRL